MISRQIGKADSLEITVRFLTYITYSLDGSADHRKDETGCNNIRQMAVLIHKTKRLFGNGFARQPDKLACCINYKSLHANK